MSKIQELVGGLFVQIEHVDSSKFPNVTVELKVENRHRQPIVGLQENNFYITENNRPVSHLKYIGSAANNKDADITIIIDNSNDSLLYAEQIEIAVQQQK
jgi:DNA-binding beta-propeller fold protein YncE